MSKKDEYLIDYEKLYPGVDIPPEVLEVLKKSDRKMMYLELDLKSEHYINKEGQEIVLPSRERSLELMFEDDSVQFASDDESTEDQAIQRIRCSACMKHLRNWRQRSWRLSRHSIFVIWENASMQKFSAFHKKA